MPRPMNVVVVEQRRIQGLLDSAHGAIGAACFRRSHDGRSGIVQDGARIAQVDVHIVVVGNDLGNAFGRRG